MDDRILVVPPIWSPDPAVFGKWPAVSVMLSRLRAFLPVDILLWPTLKGQEVIGPPLQCAVKAAGAQVRPEHHVVGTASHEFLMYCLAERRPRSFIATGFFPWLRSVRERGNAELANALQASLSILASPSQFVRIIMAGSDESTIRRVVDELQQSCDTALVERVWAELLLDPGPSTPSVIPSLYLQLPVQTPGNEDVFDYFRTYFPGARHDELHEWGFHLHEEAGGHELADKVIPFIQEVIAARNAG